MNTHRPTSAAPATVDHVAARASTARTGADAALTGTAGWPWTNPMNSCSAHQAVRVQRGYAMSQQQIRPIRREKAPEDDRRTPAGRVLPF